MNTWLVTAFCISIQCGAMGTGITQSGRKAVIGRTVACPPELEHGTVLYIEDVGIRVCEDRGSSVKGKHVDILMSNYKEAMKWGRKYREVRILREPPWIPQGVD